MAVRGRTPSRPTGVHLIAGEKSFDSFRAEEALTELLRAKVGEGSPEAVQVFRGDETSWGRVTEAARTRSLFAERKAVVVRAAEAVKGEDTPALAYLDDPTPGVSLILVAAKVDKRRSLWKRVIEGGGLISAEPLKGQKLRTYVLAELRRREIALDEAGLDELIDRVGQDLRRLMGEIDKLEAFAAGQGLSAEQVSDVLGRGLARPLYRLSDVVSGRRAGEALALVEALLEEGEPALRVLGTLQRAVRQVRGARALAEARAPREEVASRLGVIPFKVGDLLEDARRWSGAQLRGALGAIGTADRRLKLGAEPRVALAAAVVEACAGGEARRASRPGR